jgi:hypothetical protein
MLTGYIDVATNDEVVAASHGSSGESANCYVPAQAACGSVIYVFGV